MASLDWLFLKILSVISNKVNFDMVRIHDHLNISFPPFQFPIRNLAEEIMEFSREDSLNDEDY